MLDCNAAEAGTGTVVGAHECDTRRASLNRTRPLAVAGMVAYDLNTPLVSYGSGAPAQERGDAKSSVHIVCSWRHSTSRHVLRASRDASLVTIM